MPEIFDPFAQRKEPAIFDPFAQRTEAAPVVKPEESPAPKRDELAVGEELKKGAVRAAKVDLPSLWENAGVMKDVGVAATVQKRLDLFDKIESGQITSLDQLRGDDLTTSQARSYFESPPDVREKLRNRLDKEITNRKDLVLASIETLKAYQEDAKQYQPRVDKFTNIVNPTDFANWLANNVGAGAVNLAPIMLTAATTGAPGLFAISTAMGTAEGVGNRLDALKDQLVNTPKDQQAQVVSDYLQKTGGATLAAGIVSGALDTVLGPSAAAVKQLASQELKKQTVLGAAKTALKETPKQMLEEGITGAGQEAAQIAAKVATGEQKKFFTTQTLEDIINSAAAEAAGAPAGTAFNAATAAYGAARNKPTEVNKGSILDTHGEEQNVGQPINPPVGAGVGVDTQPPAPAAPTGAGEPDTSGVVRTDGAPAGPARRETAPAGSLEDFSRQYNDLRSELLGLMNKPNPTDADRRQVDLIYRDFNEVVTANADRIEAAGGRTSSFLNPAFDGNKVIGEMATNEVAGQAKAMQGDLFGSFGGANRSAQSAMALAGQDPAGALQQLEARKQRALAEFEKNRTDPTWAMTFASQLGMTKGEAARNPEAVAKHILDQTLANVDQAIDQLKRTAKPMQGDLFGAEDNKAQDEFAQQRIEQSKTARRERADEEFGAPIAGEETTEAAPAPAPTNQKEETVVAPDVSTEHVAQTQEGSTIKNFFDSIQSASETEESQKRHGESKNTAAGAMLSYDIVAPGETTSPGAKKMLDYLAKRVGGIAKLNELLAALKEATPDQQSRLFERNNLPDLTSRRGMDEFRDQVQQYVDSIGGSEQGVRLPTKNIPSPFHGRTIPYTETVTSTGVTTQTRGPSAEGKPRRPVQGTTETEHVLVDRKLRNAVLILKQALSSGKKLSPQQQAAVNYLNSTNRSSFGQALADLAFDLAYSSIDPKEHGANSTFFGEGGKYAKAFQEWITANLDQGTIDTLNEMVAEHVRNNAENEKFARAITEYNNKLDAYSEQKRKDLEKRTKTKVPRAPRKVRISDIKEEEQERGVNVKNLPRIEMITEIHPALKRLLEEGKVQEALDILANAKGNPYYAALAQRLLDTGMTAESRLLDVDVIESLNNDPSIRESLDKRLDVLRDIVVTMFPTEQQAGIIAGLRSSKLRELANALNTMRSTIDSVNATDGQKSALDSTLELFSNEFSWMGKYDPSTDQIVLRSGAGRLTNHMFLHEALHAAASHLIDNADKLTGIQRQGYERLVELYEYSKKALASEEFNNEFYDLHEFVSYAMTDPVFQAHLRTLGYKAAPYSLWNQFTEAIRKLFNAKPGRESNVMVETMLATDSLLIGTMNLQGLNEAGGTIAGPAKPMATGTPRRKIFKAGMPNQKGMLGRIMTAPVWTSATVREIRSMHANVRPFYLGALSMRQINDLIGGRIPQLSNFINLTEKFSARKNNIVKESGDISKRWEQLQSKDPDMSRQIGLVMHTATITEIDPDKASLFQRNSNQQLMQEWNKLNPEAKRIYREVRDFYERRYSDYKRLMNQRMIMMRQMGVSEKTILEIRNEFEKEKLKGPYFPLMRFGKFWYEVGPKGNREYYMFESQAAREAHIEERLAKDPHLGDTIGTNIGNDYKSQLDFHARESNFVKEMFNAIDAVDVTGLTPSEAADKKQALKDDFYQTYLQNMPDRSMRKRFVHRQNKAGYSEDALRSFASSSFNMAHQLARFEYSPQMFSQLEAAKMQIKDRYDPKVGYDPAVAREKDELTDYLNEARSKLNEILNPADIGSLPSAISNVGFIYYLSSLASAVTNVMGGMLNGLPILVGQNVRLNPNMGYTVATGKAIYQSTYVAARLTAAGLGKIYGKVGLNRAAATAQHMSTMSRIEQAAFNKFVADGLIDVTAAYDQSGLAAAPTTEYNGVMHKIMKVVAAPFHMAERFNREVVAMSAFRSGYEAAIKAGLNPRAAFTKAVQDAKDLTYRSQFDYSSTNKPRFFKSPTARVVLMFKQFPQNQTFLIANSFVNSIKDQPKELQREARARFVGIMGMAGIMAGGTGLFGFSTVAAIINAVFNFGKDDDDEEPFDFELAFANWAVETFGQGVGTAITRGVPEAVSGLAIGSRLGLNNLWFRDSKKNEDWSGWFQSALVDTLGPFVGLGVNATRAMDLLNQGHTQRAIETILPGLVKSPLVAYRYGTEGAKTLSGDTLVEDLTPFELFGQIIGFTPHRVAETQHYNIAIKGQEQEILKERQNLMNMYALSYMSNDFDKNDEVLDKIDEFNDKHPSVDIPMKALSASVKTHYKKEGQTEHGLYIDKRLVDSLSRYDYLNKQ